MIKCAVIRDLLPLTAEKMASPETEALVQAHLAVCADCRAEYLRMQEQILPSPPAVPLKAVRRELIRRRILTAALSALLVLALVVPFISFMTKPIYREYDPDKIYFSPAGKTDGEQQISVLMQNVQNAGHYWAENADGEGGILYLYAYDTLYDTLTGKSVTAIFHPDMQPEMQRITQVYYQQPDGQENILLWGEETDERQITLPRLYLGYYFTLAVVLALVLGVVFLLALLRQKRTGRSKAAAIIKRLFLAPVCYIAAHLAILQFNSASYSAQRDFLFVWCLWALLYAACLCALSLCKGRR